MAEHSVPDVDWTLARRAAYRRLDRLIRVLLFEDMAPEDFEREFLRERHALIDASSHGGADPDYDFENLVDEIWFHVDDFVPSSMGIERAEDQINEADFVARVRADWERYNGSVQ